ncbi:MAG: histone family protein [Methermicoccaceae archaeon]
MAKRKTIIPLASVERLIRDVGAGKVRVSETGRAALAEILEDYAREIAAEGIRLAAHAKRKTVRGEDITLAAERIYRGK